METFMVIKGDRMEAIQNFRDDESGYDSSSFSGSD
jgi:hypothetical protein